MVHMPVLWLECDRTLTPLQDIHVYVTGYPRFFNDVDADCDRSTFHYLWAAYNPPYDPRMVMLTTQLRQEMNGLVDQLNGVVSDAVQGLNSGQVHFDDVNPKWNNGNHHWCEGGHTHEADSTRQETWFFLGGWPDVPVPGALSAAQIEASESAIEAKQLNEYVAQGKIPLPDSNNCQSQLGTDPDPWEIWLYGPMGQMYQLPSAKVAAKKLTGLHVPFYLPTRQIKNFHPRSLGMVAYRDAIIESIKLNQNGLITTSETCSMNVTEWWTCEAEGSNLYAAASIFTPNGALLYQSEPGTTSPGQPINAADPSTLKTGEDDFLTMVGEHVNDYIQFQTDQFAWTTNTTSGLATCQLAGDDWSAAGPIGCPSAALVREYNCQYPCIIG